jgi:hypothetical protein
MGKKVKYIAQANIGIKKVGVKKKGESIDEATFRKLPKALQVSFKRVEVDDEDANE